MAKFDYTQCKDKHGRKALCICGPGNPDNPVAVRVISRIDKKNRFVVTTSPSEAPQADLFEEDGKNLLPWPEHIPAQAERVVMFLSASNLASISKGGVGIAFCYQEGSNAYREGTAMGYAVSKAVKLPPAKPSPLYVPLAQQPAPEPLAIKLSVDGTEVFRKALATLALVFAQLTTPDAGNKQEILSTIIDTLAESGHDRAALEEVAKASPWWQGEAHTQIAAKVDPEASNSADESEDVEQPNVSPNA